MKRYSASFQPRAQHFRSVLALATNAYVFPMQELLAVPVALLLRFLVPNCFYWTFHRIFGLLLIIPGIWRLYGSMSMWDNGIRRLGTCIDQFESVTMCDQTCREGHTYCFEPIFRIHVTTTDSIYWPEDRGNSSQLHVFVTPYYFGNPNIIRLNLKQSSMVTYSYDGDHFDQRGSYSTYLFL